MSWLLGFLVAALFLAPSAILSIWEIFNPIVVPV